MHSPFNTFTDFPGVTGFFCIIMPRGGNVKPRDGRPGSGRLSQTGKSKKKSRCVKIRSYSEKSDRAGGMSARGKDQRMGMKERLHTGELYLPGDEEITREQFKCLEKLYDYNQTRPLEMEKRAELLRGMFAEIGEGCYIEPPFHANFGGRHCHFGKYIYANFNLTIVDDTHVYVGDHTMFGPNVTLATAGHPIWPGLRERGYQFNLPIHIGRNCWLGAGVIVMPGITIGDNVVVGAGSVVTKNLPSNVVAVGNPCRVMREVNDKDRQYYFKGRLIEPELL